MRVWNDLTCKWTKLPFGVISIAKTMPQKLWAWSWVLKLLYMDLDLKVVGLSSWLDGNCHCFKAWLLSTSRPGGQVASDMWNNRLVVVVACRNMVKVIDSCYICKVQLKRRETQTKVENDYEHVRHNAMETNKIKLFRFVKWQDIYKYNV